MSKRGIAQKSKNDHIMTIARPMLTRNYLMKWDLDKCVGCQICPITCPKGALTHIPAVLENGRIVKKSFSGRGREEMRQLRYLCSLLPYACHYHDR